MSDRSAGILLHITSLPSEFGIGDFGPQAYAFADMLERGGQNFWQILPLNFIDAGANFSPYSSVSSMAGNILLISPELLVKDGMLDGNEIAGFRISDTDKVDFTAVSEMKNKIFAQAWQRFKTKTEKHLQKQFKKFCSEEKSWLDDFAVYSVIKKQQGEKPWFEWPQGLKERTPAVLKKISKQQAETIEKIKFLQFIFAKQWQRLKSYCNKKGIKILGDLPYYVSRDSVDVWTNPGSLSRSLSRITLSSISPRSSATKGSPPNFFLIVLNRSASGPFFQQPLLADAASAGTSQ